MYINITVSAKRNEAFLQLCPKAVVRNMAPDKVFMYYKITDREYMRNYKAIDSVCTVEFIKGTNYVKLIGEIAGQDFKLFVRETQVYKVLSSLEKLHGNTDSRIASLSVRMRKVKLPNRYNRLLEPIVAKSLAYVGIAA